MAINGVGNPMQLLQGMLGNILANAGSSKAQGKNKQAGPNEEKKNSSFQNKSKQAAQLNKLGFKGNAASGHANSSSPASANLNALAAQKVSALCPQKV